MNNKIRVSGLIVLLACVLSQYLCSAERIRPDGVILTSLTRILANPEKYKGKRIRLLGYYTSGFEYRGLFLTKEHAELGDSENGIWIGEVDPKAKSDLVDEIKTLKHGYVLLIGTLKFNSRGGVGHLGGWPAELKDITLFTRVKREQINDDPD